MSKKCYSKDICESNCKSCDDYSQKSYGQCDDHYSCMNWSEIDGCGIPCGSKSDKMGYACDSAGDEDVVDKNKISSLDHTYYGYHCMDWAFQSKKMQEAENNFNKRTKDNVYFGVGTFGNIRDQKKNNGACFRITATNVDKDIIAQSIDAGTDVDDTQFDLVMGAGGFGLFNACASNNKNDKFTMFSGSSDNWGPDEYVGVKYKKDCSNLPQFPRLYEKDPPEWIDDLRDLCRVGFDKNVRLDGGDNQTITSIGRVSCPPELTNITGMKPIVNKPIYKPTDYIFKDNKIKCGEKDNKYCLTRTMDCAKPSASFIENVNPDNFLPGAKIVQPCGQDGYNRVDNRCGCKNCGC